ncbi:MAG: polymer-forming cytoskeletal protein [bacterium]
MAHSFRDHKTTSFLGEGTELEGVLVVKGGIRIDGHVKGEIQSESVVYVGENAVIEADITAEGLISSGKVTGDVRAGQQVMVNLPGSIDGSVETRELILEKGVYFNGTCKILEPK